LYFEDVDEGGRIIAEVLQVLVVGLFEKLAMAYYTSVKTPGHLLVLLCLSHGHSLAQLLSASCTSTSETQVCLETGAGMTLGAIL
jgi:hypothetical protein